MLRSKNNGRLPKLSLAPFTQKNGHRNVFASHKFHSGRSRMPFLLAIGGITSVGFGAIYWTLNATNKRLVKVHYEGIHRFVRLYII